jgi:outer membrane protein assembly factor BamB
VRFASWPMALATVFIVGLAPGAAASSAAAPGPRAVLGKAAGFRAGSQHASIGVASWPQFHHNAALTGYNPLETTIGPGNAGSLHLLWTASTAGAAAGIGSVSIAGGRAFLGTYSDHTLRAWNASSGAHQWSAVTDSGLESTAAIGGGRAFIESDNGTLYAISTTTGAVLWSKSIGGAVTSPTLVNSMVYAAGYNTMNAFDAATGALLWSTPLQGLVRSVPALAGGRMFVATEYGTSTRNLIALKASTGSVLWTKPVGQVQLASPVVGGNTVYVCSESGLSARGVLHGDLRWSEPNGCDNFASDATPALAQGILYTAPLTGSGVNAFSASTGKLLWSAGTGGDGAAPAVANGVLYVPSGTGSIAAYDVTTHALLWTSPNDGFGESSPAVVNGILYVGGQQGLYAFGP